MAVVAEHLLGFNPSRTTFSGGRGTLCVRTLLEEGLSDPPIFSNSTTVVSAMEFITTTTFLDVSLSIYISC